MAVVRHASTSSTQGVVPSFSHAQQHLQASGVSLVQELASTRHPFSLWHMNGTQQQINNFRSRTSSIFTLQLSSAPTQRVTHSARVISSAATSSWALDILDSSSGSMDGLYTNTLQGLGSHMYGHDSILCLRFSRYIVDTGITQNATDLVGRVSYDWTAFPGQPYDCHGILLCSTVFFSSHQHLRAWDTREWLCCRQHLWHGQTRPGALVQDAGLHRLGQSG